VATEKGLIDIGNCYERTMVFVFYMGYEGNRYANSRIGL